MLDKPLRQKEERKHIDEEVVCLDSLVHHLKQRCGCLNVQFEREQNDPPDFWINIDGQRYAVEITSIVTGQDYRATCWKLKEAIERSASRKGVLNGTYSLNITRKPSFPRRSSKEWRTLIDKATSFIKSTISADPSEERTLLANENGIVGIEKFSTTGASVGLLGPTEAKYHVEAIDEIKTLIQKAITTKRLKLEKKGVTSNCTRIILALYDAYGFVTLNDIKQSLLQTIGYDWFHSIFWAASFTNRTNELASDNPGREGSFLYSKSKEWQEA